MKDDAVAKIQSALPTQPLDAASIPRAEQVIKTYLGVRDLDWADISPTMQRGYSSMSSRSLGTNSLSSSLVDSSNETLQSQIQRLQVFLLQLMILSHLPTLLQVGKHN